MFIDVVAARTVVARERFNRLDRVEEAADVGAFGDASQVGHCLADIFANRRSGFDPLKKWG